MRFHFRKDGKLYRINGELVFRACLAYEAGMTFKTYEEARDCLFPDLKEIYEEVIPVEGNAPEICVVSL